MIIFNGKKFIPGDRVEVIATACAPSVLVGKRGTVVDIPGSHIGLAILISITSSALHQPYAVDIDGQIDLIWVQALRKLDERGDWKQIERETGYTPPALVPA